MLSARASIASLAVVLVGASVAATAAAAPPRTLATIPFLHGLVVADGARYALVPLDSRRLLLFDSRTGRRWRVLAPACVPTAGAAGRFLLYCDPGPRSYFRVLDARRRRLRPLRGGRASDSFGRIGRRWVEGSDGRRSLFINLRSGRRVTVRSRPGADAIRDLDSRDLRNPHLTPSSADLFVQYEAPFALVESDTDGEVEAVRRVILTFRCIAGCGYRAHLAGARVTWVSVRGRRQIVVHGYDIRSGVRTSWRLRGVAPRAACCQVLVTQTRYAAFAQVVVATRTVAFENGVAIEGGRVMVATRARVYELPWPSSRG